jgi:hypothetical protein
MLFCLHSFIAYQLAFFRAGRLLADAESQNLYTALIRFQLAGHLHVRLPTNAPDYWGQNDFLETKNFSPSPWAKEFPETKIHHCELTFRGKKLVYDGSFVKSAWVHKARQYFFERGARASSRKKAIMSWTPEPAWAKLHRLRRSRRPRRWSMASTFWTRTCACVRRISTKIQACELQALRSGLSDKVFEPAAKQTEPKAVLPGFSL